MIPGSREIRAEVEALIHAFAHRVDREGARDMGDFFTGDAVLILPRGGPDWSASLEIVGRDPIAARWDGRPADRTTRHLHANLSILDIDSAGRVTCHSVGTGYRHDGPGPGEPTPVIVADYDDVCVRDGDGVWRFARRRITPVFVAAALKV